MLLQAAIDAASTRSFDMPSRDWGAALHPVRPFPNSEPNPATWTRPVHTAGQLSGSGHDRRANATSATWTSSSGDLADLTDTDDIEVRSEFVEEYNRLARKPGQSPPQRRSWFSRTFLRQVSVTSDASSTKSEKKIRRKRSVGDLALHLVNGAKRDNLKDADLQSLVRLCGKSLLYLPSEYSPGSLVLPTCFRATAQYLVQHVNALYSHYCADGDADEISSTICSPNLPSHIKAGTHDVASTFKRLLSGLPGGILGSVALFDALAAIHGQLDGEAELTRTKQTKVRARLIALAIGTVKSPLRRDLICAVFGLLCLIGRTAEKAPREDGHGRPLRTSDLMGYNALGIVFGPLLIGDLLNSYTMKSPDPNSSSASSLATPTSVRKERRKPTRPLSSYAGKMASVLSPPVEEPSPAKFERSKGPIATPETPKRLGIWRRAQDRAVNSLELLMQTGSPAALATPAKGQTVGRQSGMPSRDTRTPLRRRFHKDNVTADPAHGAGEQAERRKSANESIYRRTPKPVMQGPPRTITPIGPGENAPRDDTPPAAVFERGRSRLSAWKSRRSSLASAETGSPVARLTGAARLESTRDGLNQPETGSEITPIDPRADRMSHDGTQNGEFARENGRSFDRESINSIPSSATSRHATMFLSVQVPCSPIVQRRSYDRAGSSGPQYIDGERSSPNKDDRASRQTAKQTILFGPRTQPARRTLGPAPRSTPASMAGSAVKAMAAMFETASKDPTTPSSGENTRSRAESRPSDILSPYTVNPLPVKSPSRSPKPMELNGGRLSGTARDGRCGIASPPAGETAASSQSSVRGSTLNQPRTPASQYPAPSTDGSPSTKKLPRQEVLDIDRSPADRPDTITSTSRIEPNLGPTTPGLSPSVPWANSPPVSKAGCQDPVTRRFPLISTPEQKQGATSETISQTPQTIHAYVTSITPGSGRNAASSPRLNSHPNKLQGRKLDAEDTVKIHHKSAGKTNEEHEGVSEPTSAITEATPIPEPGLELGLAKLRERLREAEQACAMWQERAERAEQRVRELEAYAFVL
ncbi:hypothetical protein C8A03DRAFT_11509 [Achaetomium macrosporum]|uniref:Rho-GAP domain-containing protein n=1 Tax=Achaetomium macrosporum TaxID=79813 RepID=A0AAN7CHT0_9PEZI|nr:hypothetical protein C8A03DRAFT_11509 [Achaetomium macrosporum]